MIDKEENKQEAYDCLKELREAMKDPNKRKEIFNSYFGEEDEDDDEFYD